MGKAKRYRFGKDYLQQQLAIINKRYIAYGFKIELKPYKLTKEKV